ncbi:MAG: hypothetical protein HY922_00525 [Elusimicrobia bacterium]|nr:hypothetical protein [Elusimicrobiota bacterium]
MAIFLPAALLVSLASAAPTVTLRRGPDAPPEVTGYFTSLDRLLDSADALLWRLADSAGRPTVGAARSALAGLRSMAKDYEAVSGDLSAAAAVEESASALLKLVGSSPDADELPQEALGLVYSLQKDSLHRLAQLIQQRALEAPGPKGAIPANVLLALRGPEGSELELPALDVSNISASDSVPLRAAPGATGSQGPRGEAVLLSRAAPGATGSQGPRGEAVLLSRAALAPGLSVARTAREENVLRAALAVFSGKPRPKDASVVFGKRRIWLRLPGASLYAYPAAARAGGSVRLFYREEGGSAAEQGRLYLLSKALFDAGFAVSVESGELLATVDGTRSRLDAEGMAESFVFAARAAAAARSLTGRLPAFLEGSVSQAENAARLDALARNLVAEGEMSLPSEAKAFARGAQDYRSREGEREGLRLRMSRTLAALHLQEFPPVPVGKRTIELHFNGPIDAALARAELRLENGRLARERGYDPLARLAAAVSAPKPEAKTLLRLEPLACDIRPIGKVGSRLAERGQWRLDQDRWVVLYSLRDGPERGALLFDLLSRRAKPKAFAMGEALEAMDEAGLLRPAPEDGAPRPAWKKASASASSAVFFGRTLRPGPAVSGRVTYGRAQAMLGDRIYATPYAAGADEKALRRAKALLVTQGGPQSAMLAAAAGVPALELPQAEWTESAGLRLEEPLFAAPRKAAGADVRDLAGARRIALREGEFVKLDAEGGFVEFPEPDKQAALARLEEALSALERGSAPDSLVLWTEAQMRGSLTRPQKRELAAALRLELRRRGLGFSESDEKRVLDVLKGAGF